ncbi:MAG TPA: GAF domain-containing protein, partial [Chloroflexota bacterium]|nr:GAF domain-containing protein [Chloroflexota bacterium]
MMVLPSEGASLVDPRLRTMRDVATTITAPVPQEPEAMSTLLVAVIERTIAALRASDGWIGLIEDPVWRRLVPDQGPEHGHVLIGSNGRIERYRPERPTGPAMHALSTGEKVYVPDVDAPSPLGPFPSRRARGTRAFVVVPLQVYGRVLGVKEITFAEPRTLSPEDWGVLELYAAHAALILDRARRAGQAVQVEESLGAIRNTESVEAAIEAL